MLEAKKRKKLKKSLKCTVLLTSLDVSPLLEGVDVAAVPQDGLAGGEPLQDALGLGGHGKEWTGAGHPQSRLETLTISSQSMSLHCMSPRRQPNWTEHGKRDHELEIQKPDSIVV